jgi:hypothetical protein
MNIHVFGHIIDAVTPPSLPVTNEEKKVVVATASLSTLSPGLTEEKLSSIPTASPPTGAISQPELPSSSSSIGGAAPIHARPECEICEEAPAAFNCGACHINVCQSCDIDLHLPAKRK